MAMLEAKNLGISFGGLKAVDNFNLTIEKGELYGLIGPNGAGKTTVFNLLTGVYRPNEGIITLDGENIVGKRFVKISIPYNLKGTTLLVSVVNSVVVQEMSLYKADILKKMEPYAKGLNFTINDIRFDYKNWLSIKNEFNKESSKAFDIDAPEYYTDKDFEKICIDNDEELELQKVRENLLKNESLPAETKERIYNNILKSIKAQKLRKNEQK